MTGEGGEIDDAVALLVDEHGVDEAERQLQERFRETTADDPSLERTLAALGTLRRDYA